MNVLRLTVEDIASVLSASYTVIRIYTDTSSSGAFTTLDGTVTLVAGTESYQYLDTDGTSATWYRTAYFGAAPGESSKSTARRGETSAAYATIDELRNQTQKAGTATDVELALILDAATDAINGVCNRPDGFVADVETSTREYTGSGGTIQWIDECIGITLVEVKDSPSDTTYTSWAAADWIAATGDPEAPDLNRTPQHFLIVSAVGDYNNFTSGTYTGLRGFRREVLYARGVPMVRVTARWGYADTVPSRVKQACLAQAARWFKRGQSSWADTAANPEFGQLHFSKNAQAALDKDIRMMLVAGRFVRPAVGRRY